MSRLEYLKDFNRNLAYNIILEKHFLTPLRQARETYVCVNLLRKRNILINYHFCTFQNKIKLKKLKFYKFDIFPIRFTGKNCNLDIKIFFYKINQSLICTSSNWLSILKVFLIHQMKRIFLIMN